MYAPTGWASIICGAITVAAGLIMAICRWREQAIAYVLTGVVVVNALLHAACYHHSLQVRPNGSILTICIVELFLSVILPLENNWQSVYGLYLVMNGASLVAIPLKMSRTFGVVAIFSGIITYQQSPGRVPDDAGPCAPLQRRGFDRACRVKNIPHLRASGAVFCIFRGCFAWCSSARIHMGQQTRTTRYLLRLFRHGTTPLLWIISTIIPWKMAFVDRKTDVFIKSVVLLSLINMVLPAY